MPTEEAVDEEEDLTNDDPDTLRIMISTDNHLGFAERDNVRGMDSFAAFEEMLYLSQRFHCDLVLVRNRERNESFQKSLTHAIHTCMHACMHG